MVLSGAERYLQLGLQLGRHVEGIVDAYYGPPELASAVEGDSPVDPRALVSTAELLLGELEDGWLRDQVVGLRTYAGVLDRAARGHRTEHGSRDASAARLGGPAQPAARRARRR